MNLDELNDALSASDPDPYGVLAQFERKRLRRRRRMQTASGGMAVVVIAVGAIVGAIVGGISTGSPLAGISSSSPAGAPVGAGNAAGNSGQGSARTGSNATAPAATPGNGAAAGPTGKYPAPSGADQSCAPVPLRDTIADALRKGASVIVATGQLTGQPVTGNPATAGAPAFYRMTLSSVQTLRGHPVAPGSIAWIPGPAPGTKASVTSPLLAPGGRLFAIVWPQAVTHDLVGPTLRMAPIVGADVVFTPSGCWDLSGLRPSQYQASTSLKSVSGGAASGGLYAVPLATVEQIAARA